MGKKTADEVFDAACDKIATCVNLTVCSAEPANYAAISGVALAAAVLTAGDGNGDYVVADGDASGRKVTIGAQSAMSITASGDANHIALDDGSTLLEVTTCPTQTLTSGGTVSTAAFDSEFADPT